MTAKSRNTVYQRWIGKFLPATRIHIVSLSVRFEASLERLITRGMRLNFSYPVN